MQDAPPAQTFGVYPHLNPKLNGSAAKRSASASRTKEESDMRPKQQPIAPVLLNVAICKWGRSSYAFGGDKQRMLTVNA